MNEAVFVLSTGRCGTQWLAKFFQDHYEDHFVVTHEPLQGRLDPRKALGIKSLQENSSSSATKMREHLATITEHLKDHSYLECGHVGWSAIPHFVEALKGRVRVVHLVRHPVPTAYSWLSHGAYEPPILPHLSEKVLLSPFDPGARHLSYQDRWESLKPYEKCLYYWLEVNALAMEMEEAQNSPWLRLRAEDLFGTDGLDQLLRFLDLPLQKRIHASRGTPEDQFRYLIRSWDDWRLIESHAEVLSLSIKLGYHLEDVDEEALLRRFR